MVWAGTNPDHEPRARVLSESRTWQFSGSRPRVTNNGFIPYPFAFILFRGAIIEHGELLEEYPDESTRRKLLGVGFFQPSTAPCGPGMGDNEG